MTLGQIHESPKLSQHMIILALALQDFCLILDYLHEFVQDPAGFLREFETIRFRFVSPLSVCDEISADSNGFSLDVVSM